MSKIWNVKNDQAVMIETVTSVEYSDISTNLKEFIAWTRAALEMVPSEYQAEAMIDFEDDYEYGFSGLSVSYLRPETLDEATERRENHDRLIQEHENKERALYNALRKKYEPEM